MARQAQSGGRPAASWLRADRDRLVASAPVTHVGSPAGTHRRRPVHTALVAVASALVAVVGLVALGGQALRGSRTVAVQLAHRTVHATSIDNAFYACIDTQAHSLVRPGQSVTFGLTNLADVVNMIMGFGSWVTVADPASSADIVLTLHDGTAAPGTCLGTTVVATSRGPGGRTIVRVGTGAQVPGQGPPPAPPL